MSFLSIFRKPSREDKLSWGRNKFAELAEKTPKGGVVFFGDSITEMYDLDTYYPNKGYINRGISGNISAELMGRIFSSVVVLQPKQVVLLIGVNDLSNEIHKPYTFQNIRTIIDVLQKEIAGVNIVVQSVYPVNNSIRIRPNWKTIKEDIIDLNINIKDYCNKVGVPYIDTGKVLMSEENILNKAYTEDGLHLNAKGYEQVTKCLLPYLL